MKNALILHGTENTPEDNWFPWLKMKLKSAGYQVWVPALPQADKPNIRRYNQFLFESDWQFNRQSIIVGHSSGAVAILGLLQALPEDTQVKAVYLVGSFKDDLGWEALSELFLDPFDFNKIKQQARKFVFIHSDNDPYCPLEHAQYLHHKLGGDLVVLSDQKHFSTSTYGKKYRQFDFLGHLILEDVVDDQFVADLYQKFASYGIKVWLDGGWAVDALVGHQTRRHEDVDIILEKKDLTKFNQLMKKLGYFHLSRDDEQDYNFVLVDNQAHLVDVHVIEFDQKGNGVYGPEVNGKFYPASALRGQGKIAGVKVRCVTAEYAKQSKQGYQLRDKDRHDLKILTGLI